MFKLLVNALKSIQIRPTSSLAVLFLLMPLLLLEMGDPSISFGTVEFPGPVELSLGASPLFGVPVPWEDGITEFAVVGDDDGFINLVYHVQGETNFGIFFRYFLDGDVTWVGSWDGGPHGQRGLVAATANPDRLFFIELNYSQPYLTVDQVIDLPEDPGTGDFLSQGPQGQSQMAMSLPGIDQVLVLRQDEGHWSIYQTLNTGDEPHSLTAIDLDDDQVLELVTADKGVLSGSLSVFGQQANGSYSLQSHEQLTGNAHQVSSEDFNLDGVTELVVSYSDLAQLDILSGETGQLVIHDSVETDLESDFFQVVTLPGGSWGLLSSVQDRGFMEYYKLSGGTWSHEESYYVGCSPAMTLAADLNGNGVKDVVCLGQAQGSVSILLGNSLSEFRGHPAVALPSFPAVAVQADFDRDGLDELVSGSFGPSLLSRYSFKNAGSLFDSPNHQDLGFFPQVLTAGNFLGDSSLELVTLNSSAQQLLVLTQDSEAGFTPEITVDIAYNPSKLDAADVDADGHTDIIMANSVLKEVDILFGAGNGTFSSPVTIGFPIGVFELCVLHLNQDSFLDFVVSDGLSRVWSVTNIDGRSFNSPLPTEANTGARFLAVSDLDGDLDLDVVVANTSSESLTILENLGNGNLFRRVGSLSVNGVPAGLNCQDMDGDNIPDMVVPLVGDGGLRIALASDVWDYPFPSEFETSSNATFTRISDFNQDGTFDVVYFDTDLFLGIVMINSDQALVAVDPATLTLNCTSSDFSLEIIPDRSGPWELSLGKPGQWQLLASNGQAHTGVIDFEGRGWILEFSREDVGYPDSSMRLKLTVGAEGNQETLIMELDEDCLAAQGQLPKVRWADQPWPNPFNPRINGRIQLDSAAEIDVAVFDVAGHRVATLLNGPFSAGVHLVSWDGMRQGQTAAAGLYFLRVRSENALLSKKIMLLK